MGNMSFDKWRSLYFPMKPLTLKIGFIFLSWPTHVLSKIKLHSIVWSLYCSQGHFHICPPWPLLLTEKVIGFIFLSFLICLPNFLEESLYRLNKFKVSCMDGYTDRNTDTLLYSVCNMLHGENEIMTWHIVNHIKITNYYKPISTQLIIN